jgi:hypothetical protein
MSHDCFEVFNKTLAERNGTLAMGLQITETMGLQTRLLIATEKIDKTKRKPVPSVMASFCPFCGVRLIEAAPQRSDK